MSPSLKLNRPRISRPESILFPRLLRLLHSSWYPSVHLSHVIEQVCRPSRGFPRSEYLEVFLRNVGYGRQQLGVYPWSRANPGELVHTSCRRSVHGSVPHLGHLNAHRAASATCVIWWEHWDGQFLLWSGYPESDCKHLNHQLHHSILMSMVMVPRGGKSIMLSPRCNLTLHTGRPIQLRDPPPRQQPRMFPLPIGSSSGPGPDTKRRRDQ